jgi:hypothetical protein
MSEAGGFVRLRMAGVPGVARGTARNRHRNMHVFALSLSRRSRQGGKITPDKYSTETPAQELTDLVVAEYRHALEERQRAAS